MSKRYTIQDIRDYVIAHHPGGEVLSDSYISNKHQLQFRCAQGHVFWSIVSNVINKNCWCSRCVSARFGDERRHSLEWVKDKLQQLYPGCEVVSTEYTRIHQKIEVICENGHKFSASYGNMSQGKWCPECANENRSKAQALGITHVKQRILAQHPGCKVLSDTYTNSKTLLKLECEEGHRFVSRWENLNSGRWCPKCVQERIRQTCLERYGADCPAKNLEIALKMARSMHNSTIKLHWKTGEELVCTASYEAKVVDYLNTNQINFQWQPQVFTLSDGRTYRPDLYLVDTDLWVEVKGYFMGRSKEKWEEFHTLIKPNSELWDTPKLKALHILYPSLV